MSATYEYECVNKIKSLKQGIESATGKTYSDLTSAIQGLKDSGGNIEDFVSSYIDLGDIVLNNISDLRFGAFAECTLGNVTLSEGINDIPMCAFYDTDFYSNSVVTLPTSLRTISQYAFNNAKMSNIIIHYGVTSIGYCAFNNCTKLTSITIPDSVTTIGESAFYNCYSLTSVTIPDSVTNMGQVAFAGCKKLTSVTIGNGLTSIEASAFNGCKALVDVTIGNNVTSINTNAFYGCGIISLTIPDNVTQVDEGAFHNCTALTDVYFMSKIPPAIQKPSVFGLNCILHVPIGSGDTYKSATNWSYNSERIVEDIEL